MKVLFISSFSPIVPDPASSQAFYLKGIGLDLEQKQGDYVYSEKVPGVKHFGLWPLSEAAQACYGKSEWPADVPRPQGSLEFEVEDVAAAAKELVEKGYRLVHEARTEPWGQTVARVLSPEGLIVGLSYAPWMHEKSS